MGQSPFAKHRPSPDFQVCHRRSTRVDRAVPIVVSGRDASGQVFREVTETCTVNLHGARIKTRHSILLGMQISVENPSTGKSEKAICVRVEETQPSDDFYFIAFQLIHPCNLWGVEDPPEDWARVQAEMVEGWVPPSHGPGPVAAMTPRQPASPAVAPQQDPEQFAAEVQRRSAAIVESLVTNLRRQSEEIVVESFRQFEQRLKDCAANVEKRVGEHAEQALTGFKSSLETYQAEAVAEMVREGTESFTQQIQTKLAAAESLMRERAGQVSGELELALETVRAETIGELVREAVQDLERRSQNVVAGAESRLAQRSDQAFKDLEKALETFRAEVANELAAKRNEVVESTEKALRTKVATMLSSILGPSAAAGKEADPAASKK
ncbi:MAG: hypothetical protein HYS33_01845 [Acidobacteria bacterium]|nr:hypothetical protein [Acidobacteriota bacterium]